LIWNYSSVYFVGIGGTGMSGLAKILCEMNYKVAGSDIIESSNTKRLEEMGIKIFIGHSRGNIGDADLLVVSTAIPSNNPEVLEAKEKGINIIHRSDLLSKLMGLKKGIAVAGAHGKTTTSSMVAWILENSKLNPTVIIGGELNDIGGNAILGSGEFLVAEADESDGSFLRLNPHIAVVTNIEDEHLDYYGSTENIKQNFIEFLNKVPKDGFSLIGSDNSNIVDIMSSIDKKPITFGINTKANYMARNIIPNGIESTFDFIVNGNLVGRITLNIPGLHNIYNALAAAAVCYELDVNFKCIQKSFRSFKGIKRRFQLVGDFQDIKIIDDYAHHPTEINATLQAAKQCNPNRLIAVFQPHRYTRTRDFYREFGNVFNKADEIIVTEIFSAGEDPINGVTSELIVDSVKKNELPVTYMQNKDDVTEYLYNKVRPGDYVITLGAGDIWRTAHNLTLKLGSKLAN